MRLLMVHTANVQPELLLLLLSQVKEVQPLGLAQVSMEDQLVLLVLPLGLMPLKLVPAAVLLRPMLTMPQLTLVPFVTLAPLFQLPLHSQFKELLSTGYVMDSMEGDMYYVMPREELLALAVQQ